jgi:signal transduction histidine kinase
VTVSKLHHTLFGKAVVMLVGVVAICSSVVALALYLKGDLRRHLDRVTSLTEREYALQLGSWTTADLLVNLTLPHRGGGPDDSLIGEWQIHLMDLVKLEEEGFGDVSSRPQDWTIRQALVDLEEIVAKPTPAERIDEFISRLVPALDAFALKIQDRFDEVHSARLELAREYDRETETFALWILAVGLIGFTIVCLFVGRFFVRLVHDVQQLERRAKDISGGNYGDLLTIERKDEVGELGKAVNAMAIALAEREKEVENFRSRLFEEEKMFTMGTFAARIAHEIGNPINAVAGISEQISASLADHPDKRDVNEDITRLQMIVEQTGRLSQVIREISDFARPGPTRMEPTSVNQVIESAINLLRFDPRFQGDSVATDLDRDLPMIYAVPDHLTQIAINALINAADATDGYDAGEVIVTTSRDGTNVLITVTDNGRGMSKEVAEKALEPFFTTKPKGKGSGLGLAVCKTIVDQHSGTIDIESEPGRGTTVYVRIPVQADRGLCEASDR